MNYTGLLYSRIGYDLRDPMRAVIRAPGRAAVPKEAEFSLSRIEREEPVFHGVPEYWGEIWHSSWWILDFSGIEEPGEYLLTVSDGEGAALFESDPFRIGRYVLWEETVPAVALDQMEERVRRARNGSGWNDCGAPCLRELNSHATTVISLTELYKHGFRWMEEGDVQRLSAQILHGCHYIGLCQDKAQSLGFPDGSMIHEINGGYLVIPGDVAQSVTALAYASRMTADIDIEKSAEYLERAKRGFEYLVNRAEPFGPDGFSHLNHGAPEGFTVPGEFMTRDLLMMIWGALELHRASGLRGYKERAAELARQVLDRQVKETDTEGEFFGHFRTFASAGFTEKANIHHHVGHDTGGTFPHYIVPLMEMAGQWKDHPDAGLWRRAVHDFAYGYFLPACSANPFYLLPEGYFTGEGLLTFCGPWHGINTSYGFAAALAVRLEQFTGDPAFRKIAVGNIQWIAGLNSGITRESFEGCAKWHDDVPEDEAVPYSQICGVGGRSVGCWTNIRGTIPNGFDTNPQFRLEVVPKVENDMPRLYTDEDWIPHGAGWITALAFLRSVKAFKEE